MQRQITTPRVNCQVIAPAMVPAVSPDASLMMSKQIMAGISNTTPLESWSMGKSVTATMMGVLIQQGVYTLDQPAPIPEWQMPGDPRQTIRIQDLLHMSNGIRIKAPDEPEFDPNTYPDHLFLTGRVNSFKYAATRPPQWPPNTVGRYRNTDPVLHSARGFNRVGRRDRTGSSAL